MNPYFAEQLAAQAARQRDLRPAPASLAEQTPGSRRHRLGDMRSRIHVRLSCRSVADSYGRPVPAHGTC